ncbi:MAG: pirin family protein [Microthrixaceae bacterium]
MSATNRRPRVTNTGPIDKRAAGDRFHTQIGWLDSWHSFSFGHHYDPREQGHGLLIVNNDDVVDPGSGFGAHPHRDMEIVTWVLEGELEHRDSEGNEGVIAPGLAQRMSAGTGIMHSEMNHSAVEPVHFVQMWVVPDTNGLSPGYEQQDVSADLASGGLVPVASGDGSAAITINQQGARLWAARPPAGGSLMVPADAFAHVFVARGAVELAGQSLERGDAARLHGAGELELTASTDSEILIWSSDSEARR